MAYFNYALTKIREMTFHKGYHFTQLKMAQYLARLVSVVISHPVT